MLRVKGQDGFLPIGPELVPAAAFDPTDFTLRTSSNGEVVQEAHADDLMFPGRLPARGPVPASSRSSPATCCSPGRRRTRGRWTSGDTVEVEISGLGRLTNTVEAWDVDLSGPGEQLAGFAQPLHVALAIPEDEAERIVAEGNA